MDSRPQVTCAGSRYSGVHPGSLGRRHVSQGHRRGPWVLSVVVLPPPWFCGPSPPALFAPEVGDDSCEHFSSLSMLVQTSTQHGASIAGTKSSGTRSSPVTWCGTITSSRTARREKGAGTRRRSRAARTAASTAGTSRVSGGRVRGAGAG